jgi:hypothetical protein
MHAERDSTATPQTRAQIYLALVANVFKPDTKRYEKATYCFSQARFFWNLIFKFERVGMS